MKIAIASSGLSHITRGMEGWSEDISRGLKERGIDVTLFKGSGPRNADYEKVLPTFRRNRATARILGKLTSKGLWRIGLGSPLGIEAFFFGLQLVSRLRRGFDLVHLKQASLASLLLNAKRIGVIDLPIVLSNGQIANEGFLGKCDYVQHLTPCLEGVDRIEKDSGKLPPNRFVIPNFIDAGLFIPMDKQSCRQRLSLPEDDFIIMSAGTVRSYHKRMDYFIQEVHRLISSGHDRVHAVIAGASDPGTCDIVELGKKLLGNKLTVLTDVPREEMPHLYGAADAFVLCSLLEAFGTVIIEALSCGVPVVCHDQPSFRWIAGDAGRFVDMSVPGTLSDALIRFIKEGASPVDSSGRGRVLSRFSKDVVMSSMIDMYERILSQR